MRIGIYSPYLDAMSGGEKYMLTIATCLAKEHQVSIFWDTKEENALKQKAKEKFDIDLSSITFVSNIFQPKVSLLQRLLQSKNYDKIIVLSDGSIPFVRPQLYIHFQYPIEWVKTSWKLKLKLMRVKKIFCNSYFTKQYIDTKLHTKSSVLYPPVFLHIQKHIAKKDMILHVGRFGVSAEGVNYKKQDVMIDAFKKMTEKGEKNWRFVLVIGVRDEDKERLSNLQERAAGFPIDFVINPSNQELWKLYAQAKIYWHASGFGENLEKYPERAEHFGISTVEAMGAGAVPVVINAGGQKEIVADGENGFLWDTIDGLLQKTQLLMEDEIQRGKMSRKAQERAAYFAGDRFCKELKEIIV